MSFYRAFVLTFLALGFSLSTHCETLKELGTDNALSTIVQSTQATSTFVAAAIEPASVLLPPKLVGTTLVLALIALAFSTFVSEDAACISAGFLVASGQLAFWPAAIACLIGIFVGDALLFFLGRHLGTPALHRAPLKWFISSVGIDTAKAWFRKRGGLTILISRFVPGTRLPTYIAAGALGSSFVTFSGWFLLAAVLWTPALVALSSAVGEGIWAKFDAFASTALPVLLSAVLLLWILLRLLLPLTNHRGRRLLLGRWRRLTRWEYWPRWAFYPPLVAYIIWLGIRFRNPTVFTAVNPAIPCGGFVGESKDDILTALAKHNPHNVAAHKLLPDADSKTPNGQSDVGRITALQDFMRSNTVTFPIVLKPNVGDRGDGVAICHNQDDVDEYLNTHTADTLVQAFSPGKEFGVFYVREPGQAKGYLFGITDKCPPEVVGDGASTLEELILNHDRAVCLAPMFLDRHAKALFDIPEPGTIIPLTDVGVHSGGCAFLDGAWVHTQALADAIDRVSTGSPGFCLGRYDIRTPDIDAFKRGEQFKIVEFNGVTAEAGNVYDPKHSLLNAYKTLGKQWRLAFEIGAANHAKGAPVTSFWTLLMNWRDA